jgi:hypothetical protein
LCASLWNDKSALILLMHGTNMKTLMSVLRRLICSLLPEGENLQEQQFITFPTVTGHTNISF